MVRYVSPSKGELNKDFQLPTFMILLITMFHRAFFNSIIDKHQHMHFTFNNILV